eukprot:jgi/Chlat1/2234/Chrsp17S02549
MAFWRLEWWRTPSVPPTPTVKGEALFVPLNIPQDLDLQLDSSLRQPLLHTRAEIKDRWRLCFWAFFLLGLGMLFPYNAFITAQAYFSIRFQHLGSIADEFASLFAFVYLLSSLLSLLVFVKIKDKLVLSDDSRVGSNGVWRESIRIGLPLAINIVVCILAAVLALVTGISSKTVFILSLVCMAILGIDTALLQCGIFGLAGRFPPLYMNAVISGQGVAGSLVALSQVLALLSTTPTDKVPTLEEEGPAAFRFFLVAVAASLLAILAYITLGFLPLACYHAVADRNAAFIRARSYVEFPQDIPRSASQPLLAEIDAGEETTDSINDTTIEAPSTEVLKALAKNRTVKNMIQSPNNAMIITGIMPPDDESGQIFSLTRESGEPSVAAQIAGYGGALAAVFVVTLTIFPGLISSVRSVHNPDGVVNPPAGRVYGDLFLPLLFLVFNTLDTVGRLMSNVWPKQRPSARVIWIAVSLRVFLVPLFAMSNLVLSSSVNKLSVVTQLGEEQCTPPSVLFTSDWYPFLLSAVIAVTNGYFSSMIMMHTPGIVPPYQRDSVGGLLAIWLSAGLTLGSAVSFGVRELVCCCNPFSALIHRW